MKRELHGEAPARGWAERRARWRSDWPRRSRIERLSWWMLAAFLIGVLDEIVGIARGISALVITVTSLAAVPLLVVLTYRWFSWRVLWKVRNRLILTYLLMGLAPVVLFISLAGVAAYVLSGQYATDTALSRINQALYKVRDEAGSAAVLGMGGLNHVADVKAKGAAEGKGKTGTMHGKTDAAPAAPVDGSLDAATAWAAGAREAMPVTLAELRGGAWVPLIVAKGDTDGLTAVSPPSWLQPGFKGIVEHHGRLYLCSEARAPRNGHMVVTLASSPLTTDELTTMANGLGRITLSEMRGHVDHEVSDDGVNIGIDPTEDAHRFSSITSGPMARSTHVFDPPVVFTTPTTVTAWETGEPIRSLAIVVSRASLLYTQLFASSMNAGSVVRGILIGIAIFFAVLEVLALLMAASLSRTITRSVADLYQGTRAVDAGDLSHRIPVRRRDQLSALANSFNGMTQSVSDLLEQQREKERLLNELAIAQEVQTTLFPRSPAFLGGLEVHGACMPARTVGGDYFDFVFGEGAAAGSLLLALGDISGKGISAALLMSSLQSAVRAFSIGPAEMEDLPPSPGILLKLLNEHLFRSTQPARYATLFLAVYDAGTGKLTYANAGHLPPLIISADGTVQRLDAGGTVVGLLEFVAYEEATVQMHVGDLLVAFTDGLTEPERQDEDFGEERLLNFVQARRTEPLTVLGQELLHEVQGWIGEQEQPDDMTVVLARQR